MKKLILFTALIIIFGFINIQSPHAQEGAENEDVGQSSGESSDVPTLQSSEGVEGIEVAWGKPTNLSKSGAASQPRLLTDKHGRMQAFWWDRFDGLTTSIFDEGKWSNPVETPLASSLLTAPPTLFLDSSNVIHAFWREGEVGGQLKHSRMVMGSEGWSQPQVASESVLSFSAAVTPAGELILAFYRTQHTDEFPAGVYIKKFDPQGQVWTRSMPVHNSIYYRLMSQNRSNIKLSASSDGVLHLVWELPSENSAMYSSSDDGGFTWIHTESFGEGENNSVRPRLMHLSGNQLLRMWQEERAGGCTLHQQELSPQDQEGELQFTIGASQIVLNGLRVCPSREQIWHTDSGLLWVWGEGSPSLTISAFSFEKYQWSNPRNISVSFPSEQENRQIGLVDLHAVINNEQLVVIGVDSVGGEIWVTNTEVGYEEVVFSPAPTWSIPFALAKNRELGLPAMAVDGKGFLNILWSQSVGLNRNNISLLYARGVSSTFIAPVTIVGGNSEEFPRQPAVKIDQEDRIHLVWSDVLHGQILYRRAAAGELLSERDWLPAVALTSSGIASWPQIGIDDSGRLYVAYLTPLNEGRGVYFVQSVDGGDSWSKPQQIFDAASQGWPMLDHLTMAVERDGSLHVAFVKNALPGTLPPMGVYYIHSSDQGKTWSSPVPLAGEGSEWPRLALSNNQLHVLYSSSQGVWHRWAGLSGQTEGEREWSLATRVPGWYQISAPFGVAVDGAMENGTIHLVGASIEDNVTENNTLLYSTWDGSRWIRMDPFVSSSIVGQGLNASAAAPIRGGVLAVAWTGQVETPGDGEMSTLYLTSKKIPPVDNFASAYVQLTPAAPEATPTPLPPIPTQPPPTPDLNRVPLQQDEPVNPLALGGGLAALAVASVFGVRMVWFRKK